MAGSDAFARITRDVLKIVAAMPRGRVTTFLSIGDCIDVPSRHVAYVLSREASNVESAKLPLHRVVGKDGKVPAKPTDAAQKLAIEKISVTRGVVDEFVKRFIDAASLNVKPEARLRPAQYAANGGDVALSNMRGLGPASLRMLVAIDVTSAKQLRAADPFDVYAAIKKNQNGASVNLLYALIGAIEGRDWREVARTEKTRILLRLDDMGIAPR
jgi:DNA transformation protein and related proteins